MNQMDLTLLDALRRENPELPVFFAYVNDEDAWQTVIPATSLYAKLSDYAITDRGLLLDSHDEATEYDLTHEIHKDPRLTWEESKVFAKHEIAEANWKPCILVVLS